METVKFYFWADQKADYCTQLDDIVRIYFKTKIDQARLAEQQDAGTVDLATIEVVMHLYTHILMLAQHWQYQIQTLLQSNLARQQITGATLD